MWNEECIDDFSGENEYLSNFSRHSFNFKDRNWPTSEHAYQAMKFIEVTDQEIVRKAKGPAAAKKLGQSMTMRYDWNKVKFDFMRDILVEKFTQNPELLMKLKNTGEKLLIEGNHWHDNIWGDCNCEKCKKKTGKNALGNLLMWIREAY